MSFSLRTLSPAERKPKWKDTWDGPKVYISSATRTLGPNPYAVNPRKTAAERMQKLKNSKPKHPNHTVVHGVGGDVGSDVGGDVGR